MGRKGDYSEEVLRLYAEGQSVSEILEFVDLNYDSVIRLLKKKGVYKKPVKKADTDSKRNLLELMKADEKELGSKTEIKEKEYFYAGHTFDTDLQLRNFKIELGKEIRKLFKDGMSREAIAEKYGIGLLSVARFLD